MTHKISDISHFALHLSAEKPQQTAVDLLAENTPLSKQKIKNTMTNGAVWLESSIGIHRLRRAKKVVENNSVLHLYYDEKIQATKPDEAMLISDEGEYSIWNKPYGMYSQGTKWGDHCTIYRWAEEHLKPQRPAFLVHRLDRAANGLIILAHTKKTSKAFADLFQKRQIKKQYLATVEGVIDGITLPYTISSKIDNKSAISIITAVKQLNDKKTLVTIEIKTGRKHQIRKHLSEFGYPIIGDRLHGSGLSDNNLQLQSNYLQFNCPITNEMREYSL
jgi:tRNA pseudouridine32 synthase/23S rRNA pseudouridine746 synthase